MHFPTWFLLFFKLNSVLTKTQNSSKRHWNTNIYFRRDWCLKPAPSTATLPEQIHYWAQLSPTAVVLVFSLLLWQRCGSGGIRTHASEETGALNQRLRPLGHATRTGGGIRLNLIHTSHPQTNDIKPILSGQMLEKEACFRNIIAWNAIKPTVCIHL